MDHEVPLIVGGEPQAPAGRERLPVRSPATGETLAHVVMGAPDDVDRAVAAAGEAAGRLAGWSERERGALLARVSETIAGRRDAIAHDLAAEQGKPLAEAAAEVDIAVEMWREAGELIRHWTHEVLPSDDPDRRVLVTRRPHGVVGVITPWNFPATIPTEYLCAGLAAGNAIVWKPSELTPLTAEHLMGCLADAGAPPGAVGFVPGDGPTVGQAIAAHPGIHAVGVTGSPATGDAVARTAGPKPLLLELGGNNPTIVCDDADVAWTAERLRIGCYANAGQICSSVERVIVHRAVHDELCERLVAQARSLTLGPSLEPGTTLGPLNNEGVAAKVDRHLADAVERGAKIATGGRRAPGWPTDLYYEPTVLVGLTPEMAAAREETFGPVAALVAYDEDAEAVALANDHPLGLIAGVVSADADRAAAIGRQLHAGIVNVGDIATVWQPHTPFGGFSGRASGVGRLGGRWTIEALSQTQTFVVPRSAGSLP